MSDGINLVDLTPLLAPRWDWFFDPSYVIHKGLVKTQGIILNDLGAVSLTMFTGLPAEVRPASSVSVPLFADELDTEWVHAATGGGAPLPGQYPKGYLPISLSSTVHPDGTWTLDTLPSEALAGTSPFFIAIMLNASWPVATSSDAIPATEPLGPYLDPAQFTDIDSGICLHGNWVHLTGRIQAVESSAGSNFFSILTSRLPPKYRPDEPSSTSPTGQFNFANTFATAPCGRAAVQVVNDSLDMAFEPYSLAQSGDPYSSFSPPVIPGLLQGRGATAGEFEGHPAGFPYQAADSCSGEVAAAGFVAQNTITRWGFPTCFVDCGGLPFAFGWVPKNNDFLSLLGPVPDADLRGAINAFARAPDWVLILAGVATSQNWGGSQIPTRECGGPPEAGNPGVCYLNVTGQPPTSTGGYTRYLHDPQLGGSLTTATLATDVASRQLDVVFEQGSGLSLAGYLGESVGWADHHSGLDGWSPAYNDQVWQAVIAPPTRQYDTYGPGTTSFMDYLWRPDLAPNTGATTLGGGICTGLDEIVDWVVIPYYETSRHYVKAGDEVSFDGAGYASRAKGALMSLT